MATNTEEVEWVTHIKPILTASYSNFNKSCLSNLISGIVKSEKALEEDDKEFEAFYAPYATLCAHYICSNASSLDSTDSGEVSVACRLLLKYLLHKLQNYKQLCPVSQKHLVLLLKGLCKGAPSLCKSDVVTYTTQLKTAKLPPCIKTGDGEVETSVDTREIKRPRLDTWKDIFTQMTSLLEDAPPRVKGHETGSMDIISSDGDTAISHITSAAEQTKSSFASRNLQMLQELQGGDILLEVCLDLPYLKRYISHSEYFMQGKGLNTPTNMSEAIAVRSSLQSVLNDISIMSLVFSLPVLEPLTSHRLTNIVTLVLACLHAAVSTVMANGLVDMATSVSVGPGSNKDEEVDTCGKMIMHRALEIVGIVQTSIHQSTRAGGSHLRNFQLLVALTEMKTLEKMLALAANNDKPTDVKVKDVGGGGSVKSVLGVLGMTLSHHVIVILSQLLADMEEENRIHQMPSERTVGLIDLHQTYSAHERIQFLSNDLDIGTVLLHLLEVTFSKALALKSPNKSIVEELSMEDIEDSCSDTNTCNYDDDDFSSDHSTDDDEDSEPILGQLFKEVMGTSAPSSEELPPPPPPVPAREVKHKPARLESRDVVSTLPDKRDPHGFITVATEILEFFNTHLMHTPSGWMEDITNLFTVTPVNMGHVTTVITELQNKCPNVKEASGGRGGEFKDFSVALTLFCHNLVKMRLTTVELQESFLSALGINPSTTDPWPLSIPSSSLAILTEVILLLQQQERRGSGKARSDVLITAMWNKCIDTLVSMATSEDCNIEEREDLNVEHCQVLLFLFHSLLLMQKKILLLQLANKFCQIVDHFQKQSANRMMETVPLATARLLLVMDYLLHYFYDPPSSLVQQVQWNLFAVNKESSDSSGKQAWFVCKEVQDNYTQYSGKKAKASDSPEFYNLAPTEYSTQDAPKIDGLACSFLLGHPKMLDYNQFYIACIKLLNAGSKCQLAAKDGNKYLAGVSLHYHMVILWRLLACLPPSVQCLQQLGSLSGPVQDCIMLHTIRWIPRLAHTAFSGWIKDCLVKQGQTTQQADHLLTSLVKKTNTVEYDVNLARRFIQGQISVSSMADRGEILTTTELPLFTSVYMLDTIIAKVQASLEDLFVKSMSETDPRKNVEVAQDLVSATLILIEIYTVYIRSSLLNKVSSSDLCLTMPSALKAYGTVLSVGSSAPPDMASFASSIMGLLPNPVRSVIDEWLHGNTFDFPAPWAWRNAYCGDIIPVESYLSAVFACHMSTLSGQSEFSLDPALRHTLNSLVSFLSDLIIWCPDEISPKEGSRVLLPLACDATTEYTLKNYWGRLEHVLGAQESPEFLSAHYSHVLNACCELITTHANKESGLDEGILHQVLIYLEQQLDKPQGRVALHDFFTNKADLIRLLLSATSESLSHMYGTKVLKFFNKLFQLAEKFPNDKSYLEMCSSLSRVAQLDTSVLQGWLSKMITTPPPSASETPSDSEVTHMLSQGTATDAEAKLQENRLLLQSITSYIVKDGSHVGEEVAKAILNALIPMGSQILSPTNEGMGFSELVVVMATLAGAGSGAGHLSLIQAATEWLELCKTYLSEPRVLEKLGESGATKGRHHTMLESACYLLSYIGDILSALKHSQAGDRAMSPPHEGESGQPQEMDSDWADDLAIEEDDSGGEDSDDESLNNKLCTFTVTQKEFMNQHWYHCHTCKMVDGIGVCTVCAKVCHKDHDLSYAKYGSFFCDCGAKEDGTCIALIKRTVPSGLDSSRHEGQGPSPFSMESMLTSSLRRRLQPLSGSDRKSEGKKDGEKGNKAREALCKQIQSWKLSLLKIIQSSNTVNVVIDLLRAIMPNVVENYHQMSPVGSMSRAYEALEKLKNEPKSCDSTDQLMTATLGSQEGAFENVRMTFTGDQGQQIRQLINNHVLRRVAMCCLTSPHGKRQHLAVSHEKGKVTILQLSALLKQADSSKRKLTLTRLSSAPIPFTAISITGNPCNEDFLAVCGLKECHVLTLTSGGSVADHLVLHPSLDSGNFIIKAMWLPGSQTELALVTADFVKVYDLSVDAISPQFYFLLPSGKVRDVTFICREDSRWLVVNTSSGYIYWQVMDEQSSATHGPFYITNILEVEHSEVKEQGGSVCGGGVSVYYSHMLQLLFFSYSQGKTFAASLPKDYEGSPKLFQVVTKSSGGSKNNSPQALVGWSEVASHPGLVCAMTQSSNNPVILMVKPDTFLVQEIKVQPAKAKIQDMVVIRHSGGHSDQRTTLILLCEDGSLKIYMANTENTNYWLSPNLQPQNLISVLRPTKKKRPTKPGTAGGQVNFPVDFFEHCTQTSDVEFGGKDLLQLYNTAQLKHRLSTAGMNVASTKPTGFTLEITNTNASHVMVGVRVMLGSQNTERAPSTLEVFGRPTVITTTRSRWLDLPFTREESLTADKKCTLTVGVSSDPNAVTMIDMVKVYCKTKENFGWPEDMEDYQEGASKVSTSGSGAQYPGSDGDMTVMRPIPLTSVDRLLASSLEVLDGCFCSQIHLLDESDPTRQATVALATQLLTLPVPTEVHQNTKNLLADLFASKMAYHLHKDEAQLSTVISSLRSSRQQTGSDPESFQKLLLTARSVAIARPQNLVKFCEQTVTTTEGAMSSTEAAMSTTESAMSTTGGDLSTTGGELSITGGQLSTMEGELSTTEATEAMDDQEMTSAKSDHKDQGHFLTQLVDMFWTLHNARPSNPLLAPACMPGLTQIEATVQAIIEIIHAFTTVDLDCVGVASRLYISLLLSTDSQVSFASKQALIRVLRPKQKKKRVFIPSPPRCSTPGGAEGGEDEEDDDDGDDKRGGGGGAVKDDDLTPQEELAPPLIEEGDSLTYEMDPPEPMLLDPSDPGLGLLQSNHASGGGSSRASALEALLSGASNFPDMLDLPPDADDETMVELAIALSLQEEAVGRGGGHRRGGGGGGAHAGLGLQGLRIPAVVQGGQLESGHLSDTTASAPGSDDEGLSTTATDGSNLRTSPAEQAGSAGSESGGSNMDSVSVSGRSSAYGEPTSEGLQTGGGRSETSSVGVPSTGGVLPTETEEHGEYDADTTHRWHVLRLMLLEQMMASLPDLRDVGGVRAIPFMQVVLMLTSDLEGGDDKDKVALDILLATLLRQLTEVGSEESSGGGLFPPEEREEGVSRVERMTSTGPVQGLWCRSLTHEVQLVVMRLLSVFMSRTKSGSKSHGEGSDKGGSDSKPSHEKRSLAMAQQGCLVISSFTAKILETLFANGFFLQTLKAGLEYWKWKNQSEDQEGSVLPGQLLKPHPSHPPLDMSPFFLRQYVKSHANDVFEDYPQLLTEMILRLPYQIKKISESSSVSSPTFDQKWFHILAEYMMIQQAPFVRRQVRKLLLYICGSKDKYRQLRDTHALETHMGAVREICKKGDLEGGAPSSVILPYDQLIALVEHLKSVSEIASSRTLNWQRYCGNHNQVLLFLVQAVITLDEAVSPLLLQLLQCALCGGKVSTHHGGGGGAGVGAVSASPSKQKKERENKDKEKDKDGEDAQHDEGLCMQLVQAVSHCLSKELLLNFMRCFLLQSNSTSVRWQAHSLILHIYRCSNTSQQEGLLDLLWSLWGELPYYGRKGAQFVDLLGYFSLKTPQSDRRCRQYIERAVCVLKGQNKVLANHPNGALYNLLQGLVDFDGYYLESDPCLVCNNPEVPYSNVKLSSIKVDSKFTTCTQIVKLVGSHTISKITLRIADLKRTKMVRTLNFYYNNRTVQAVVELKNKTGIWHKAKKVVLSTGQTEVKVDFPLPITACNLMIEYADFYDNLQGTAETLQCPRCSASVPANPGVCGNCGENVFQCHKCRAINYDEKDPFLCNACGFCKYAKFDFTLYAKPCCAVDPIESEEDRKKAVSSINTLLEKADRLYRQLQVNRPALESLLFTVSEHASPDRQDDLMSSSTTTTSTGTSTAGAGSSTVNKAIYQLAQKYCGDCKGAFDELSKVIQKIIASRRELVEYDRQQRDAAAYAAAALPSSAPPTPDPSVIGLAVEVFPKDVQVKEVVTSEGVVKERESRLVKCYGCASATVEHCVTLLRALSTNTVMKSALCQQGLIKELINYNLKRGSVGVRSHVRLLLCLLTRDNAKATEELNSLLTQRIVVAIQGHLANPDFASAVRHEMMLLATTVLREDKCWEARIRAVLKLFLVGMKINSPDVLEFVCLPCLRILKDLIKPESPSSKKNKDKAVELLCSVKTGQSDLHVDVRKFLAADPRGSYDTWRHNIQPKSAEWLTLTKKKKDDKVRDKELEKRMTRVKYLMEKYGHLWRQKTVMDKRIPLLLSDKTWLRRVMFSPSSRSTRDTACRVVEAMCQLPGRKQEVIDMLTSYLEDIGTHGESSREYLTLYKSLIASQHWKFYLALKGVLTKIGLLISKEIDRLTELEETSLSSDLSLGYSLKALTELMAMFVEEPCIKQHYKNRLVGVVLNGYLSLKRLVVQRTKLIDLTQEELLDLLEDMTTGTDVETKEFMSVCVETVKKYPLKDQLSPVFIFERLCSIIFPEENDVGEFFLSLEKDPQQEDFLQGRMLGNPYSSNEPGLGPLMRDIKNKICTDCELVALLEDDTGMELLVNNKIISLDLPVKDVYKKIWSGESEPMRVVYRMRGLLGDATEDMINSLDSGKEEGKDDEEVYKMAADLSDNGGLRVMLQRLSSIRDLVSGKQLLSVLLKLFGYCVKVQVNRKQLIKPEMNTISIMLGALNLALLAEQESGTSTKGQTLTERILAIMEQILQEASSHTLESYKEFSKLCGDQAQLMMLLDRINSPFVRANPSVLQALMKLIPFLAFGDQDKMLTLVNHFKNYLSFDTHDEEYTEDEQVHLDCFCVIADGIEINANGERLKDMMLSHNIPTDAIDYILAHAPEIKTLLPTDSDKWKDFLSKPALPYTLRILAGLSKGHLKTQILVGKGLIPILHKLEQVSSEGSIGSLAENLMEALRGNQLVAEKIEEIRQKTKAEKKRLAMAVREKHLKGMGMTTNEKGQVKVESSMLKQMEDLKEETGLVCCICREGYRYQLTKVLGIYTYTKRVTLESLENKPRKSQGYSTVSHFNVVHIDCHLEAVRLARGREEWESAVLQNANTRCNGLLPLWGPTVPESAFASCLVRHNTYLQDCTGMRDPSYPYTVHDLKHLLMKFTFETSFSEDSGGGGRQSNVHLVPYMMHLALYVINTTRAASREEKNINNFLQAPREKWLENCFEPEGVLFYMAMAAHILPKESWEEHKLTFLKRTLVRAQVGATGQAGGETSLKEKSVKAYSDYKPYLLFWALIRDLYHVQYRHVKSVEGDTWPVYLAEYIRQNDQVLLQQSDKFLAKFEEELLPLESFMEFCDVTGLLEEITDPDTFLSDLMTSLP